MVLISRDWRLDVVRALSRQPEARALGGKRAFAAGADKL